MGFYWMVPAQMMFGMFAGSGCPRVSLPYLLACGGVVTIPMLLSGKRLHFINLVSQDPRAAPGA